MADIVCKTPAELMSIVGNQQDLRFKFNPVFTTLFFPIVSTFGTRQIHLDQLDNEDVTMSAFCSPMVGAAVQRDKGFQTKSFVPGYQKPKHSIDPSKTVARLPGEDPAALLSPTYRRERLVSSALEKQQNAIKARAEWLAVQAITTGKNIIEGEAVERYEIDWGIDAGNIITQAGSVAWSGQDADEFDPTDDIEMYSEQCASPVNIIVMGGNVWRQLRKFKKFREYFETRRGSQSSAELALKNLGDVVSVKGYLGDVLLVVYSGRYKEGDEEKYYLDPDMIVLGNTFNKGVMAYGAIQEQNAVREGMTEVQYYPRNWMQEGDPAIEYVQTHSSPQPVPVNINRFVTVTIA